LAGREISEAAEAVVRTQSRKGRVSKAAKVGIKKPDPDAVPIEASLDGREGIDS
jgi:hypothetical protein